jgi:hypothetical protein
MAITSEEESIRQLFKSQIAEGYSLISTHPYHDANGQVTYYRPRLTHESKGKIIRPVHSNHKDEFKFGEPDHLKGNGKLKPLYNLHLLARFPNAVVYIVEGENVADCLNLFFLKNYVQTGYIAVTSGGVTSAETVEWSALKGRNCVIWGDNDEPGKKYVEILKSKLQKQAVTLKIIDIDSLSLVEGGDFVDWHEQNPQATINGLENLSMALADETNQSKSGLIGIILEDLINLKIKPREYILSPWLPSSGVCMVHAYRGVGKTFFALEVAVAIATGGTFLSFKAPKPRKVLFIDGEMPAFVMQERLNGILSRIGCRANGIQLKILTPDLQDSFMPNLSTEEGQTAIGDLVKKADLITVDNIATLCSFDKENEIDSWRPVQGWALKLRKLGKSVLFIHHSGKKGLQRGTSGREDIQDTVINLKHPSDYEPSMGACFEVHFEKARSMFGDDALPLRCQLTEDGWQYNPISEGSYHKVLNLMQDGYVQKDVAKELGLTKGYVSKLGKRQINPIFSL